MDDISVSESQLQIQNYFLLNFCISVQIYSELIFSNFIYCFAFYLNDRQKLTAKRLVNLIILI